MLEFVILQNPDDDSVKEILADIYILTLSDPLDLSLPKHIKEGKLIEISSYPSILVIFVVVVVMLKATQNY